MATTGRSSSSSLVPTVLNPSRLWCRLQEAFTQLPRVVAASRSAGRRRDGGTVSAAERKASQGFGLEMLEPRMLLSADLMYGTAVQAPTGLSANDITTYVSALTATTFTLKAEQSGENYFWNLYSTGLDGNGAPALAGHIQITLASDLHLNLKRNDFGFSNSSIGLNDFIGDKLTIDTESLAVLNGQFGANQIEIDFNGGKDIDLGNILGITLPLSIANDQVVLAGDGAATIVHGMKVHSTSDIVNEHDGDGLKASFVGDLEILSDSKVTIDGGSSLSASNITLHADAKSTSGLFQGLLADASSSVTLADAALTATGGAVKLLSTSDVTFTEKGDTFFKNGLSGTVVLSISKALVDVHGNASINAKDADFEATIHDDITATGQFATVRLVSVNVFNTPEVKIGGTANISLTGGFTAKAGSDITVVNTTVPTTSGGSTSTDAAGAVSIIRSAPTFDMTGGTINATGGVSMTANNTVNVSSTADGKQGGSDDNGTGGAGAAVGVTVLWGDTSATITGGSVSGAGVTLTASSDRTAITVANATEGGSDSSGGNNESKKRLADPNPNKASDGKSVDQAKTSDGALLFAAGVAVGVLTGDATAQVSNASVAATGGTDIVVSASNKHTVATTADGSKKTGSGGTAVGVAVAIQVVDSDSTASIDSGASLTAANVNVSSVMPASAFDSKATAGASGSGISVAGAVAINVSTLDAKAQIGSGTPDVHDANVALTATSNLSNTAKALGKSETSGSVGVGAAL
ncbi:MAG: hypothetical protein JWR07_1351, partial [Nevskia sp.]|nr:hypothetical protein [Nevskia sp.]